MTLLRENNNERGKNILACVFSRLVKSAADIAAHSSEQLCRYGLFWNVLTIP